MKTASHLKILINSTSVLSGLALYFLLVKQFLFALIIGIFTMIYGNLYGSYITKRVKKELPSMLMSLFVSKEDEAKTLNTLLEMKK